MRARGGVKGGISQGPRNPRFRQGEARPARAESLSERKSSCGHGSRTRASEMNCSLMRIVLFPGNFSSQFRRATIIVRFADMCREHDARATNAGNARVTRGDRAHLFFLVFSRYLNTRRALLEQEKRRELT